MDNNEKNIALVLTEMSQSIADLKDLFLRRLVDDKVKVAAINELSKNFDEQSKILRDMHFESLIKELILICDRIEANTEASDFDLSIRDELLEVFYRKGICQIASSYIFDPSIHNAIKAIPSDERTPNNTIVKIIRNGYMLGNKVIRPIDVIVASDRLR